MVRKNLLRAVCLDFASSVCGSAFLEGSSLRLVLEEVVRTSASSAHSPFSLDSAPSTPADGFGYLNEFKNLCFKRKIFKNTDLYLQKFSDGKNFWRLALIFALGYGSFC